MFEKLADWYKNISILKFLRYKHACLVIQQGEFYLIYIFELERGDTKKREFKFSYLKKIQITDHLTLKKEIHEFTTSKNINSYYLFVDVQDYKVFPVVITSEVDDLEEYIEENFQAFTNMNFDQENFSYHILKQNNNADGLEILIVLIRKNTVFELESCFGDSIHYIGPVGLLINATNMIRTTVGQIGSRFIFFSRSEYQVEYAEYFSLEEITYVLSKEMKESSEYIDAYFDEFPTLSENNNLNDIDLNIRRPEELLGQLVEVIFSGFNDVINFIDTSRQKLEKKVFQNIFLVAGGIILLLLLVTSFTEFALSDFAKRGDSLQNEVVIQTSLINKLNDKRDEIKSTLHSLNNLKNNQTSVSSLFKKISMIVPREVLFTNYTFTENGNSFYAEITGLSEHFEEIGGMMLLLESMDGITSVKLKSSESTISKRIKIKEKLPSEVYKFTIYMEYRSVSE